MMEGAMISTPITGMFEIRHSIKPFMVHVTILPSVRIESVQHRMRAG